jgi:hypothetical protein
MGDLDGLASGMSIAAMAGAQHFLRGKPVFAVSPFRTAGFDPEEISGVLDLGLGGLMAGTGGGAFHVGNFIGLE